MNVCIHDFDDVKEESNKAASNDKHLLQVTGILSLLVGFGKSLWLTKACNSSCLLPITHKQIGRVKWLIGAWKLT